MRAKTKKATFNLQVDTLENLEKAVNGGMYSSKNALVEQALRKELKELHRQARQKSWQEAARDPDLIKDIADSEVDFEYADFENIGQVAP